MEIMQRACVTTVTAVTAASVAVLAPIGQHFADVQYRAVHLASTTGTGGDVGTIVQQVITDGQANVSQGMNDMATGHFATGLQYFVTGVDNLLIDAPADGVIGTADTAVGQPILPIETFPASPPVTPPVGFEGTFADLQYAISWGLSAITNGAGHLLTGDLSDGLFYLAAGLESEFVFAPEVLGEGLINSLLAL
jgi:hypothetical protein